MLVLKMVTWLVIQNVKLKASGVMNVLVSVTSQGVSSVKAKLISHVNLSTSRTLLQKQ